MSGMTEYLRRAVAPRLVVTTSRWRAPQRWRAAARRALGLRPRIELFFAFDDPYSAIALPGLIEIARCRDAELRLLPLLVRGIDGDPAASQRRLHAVTDSRRLALRDGRNLQRHAPLGAEECAFLARWTAAAQDHPQLHAFVAAALHRLWFVSADAPRAQDFQALYLAHLGSAPPSEDPRIDRALTQNAERLRRLGHWESPAARVGGEWFFAHERLPQIDACLRALGA